MYRLVGASRFVYTEVPSASRFQSRPRRFFRSSYDPPCRVVACLEPCSFGASTDGPAARGGQGQTRRQEAGATESDSRDTGRERTLHRGVPAPLGDRFEVKKIGITVFGNEFKEITVDNWGLDDLVVERVRAAVGPGPAVRRIAYAKGSFDGYVPGIGMFQNLNSKAPEIVRQAAAPAQCERYVVVTRAVAQYVGNQSIFGLGIVNSGRPILSTTALHAVVRIHIHDGQTFAVLKSGAASLGGSSFLSGPPTRKLDDSWWPEPPEGANTLAMREATRKLLGEALDKSLPELLAQ